MNISIVNMHYTYTLDSIIVIVILIHEQIIHLNWFFQLISRTDSYTGLNDSLVNQSESKLFQNDYPVIIIESNKKKGNPLNVLCVCLKMNYFVSRYQFLFSISRLILFYSIIIYYIQ